MVRVENRLCRLLGIEYPILQGGMAYVSESSLAAAVSMAGGLGVIAAADNNAEWVKKEIIKVRKKTDKPFGVNIFMKSPHVGEIAKLVIEEKVPVVTTGAGDPSGYINKWKEHGIIVIPVIPSPKSAVRVAEAGADAVIAEGMESGGHIGKITTMVLVPEVADAVDIPVIAAGGIADGRGVAAAFMLGACGVQIGTRFMIAKECKISQVYKDKILKADALSTEVVGDSIGRPVRSLNTPFISYYREAEVKKAGKDQLEKMVSKGIIKAVKGDVENGSFVAGQIVGMINKEQTAAEIIKEIWREACCIGTIN